MVNHTNSNQSSTLKRKPFVETVQDWTKSVELKFQTSRVFQSTQNSLAVLDDNRSFEDLLVEMNRIQVVSEQFLFACKNGNDATSLQLLKELLLRKVEQRANNDSDNCRTYVTELHLNKVIDKSCSNCSLMHLCAQRNKVLCMDLLYQNKVQLDSIDAIAATPLLHAVAHNCEEAAALLLSKGANINTKDSYNKFPLLVALKNKHYRMAELLASFRQMDVHLRGTKGNTALHFMVEEGDYTATKFLVETLAASPQRRNNDEENALYCSLAHIEVVHYLASQFATSKGLLNKMVMSKNTFGRTLFHRCAIDGHIDSMLLIMKKMEMSDLTPNQIYSLLNDPDKNGDTPLHLAVKNAHKEFIQFLCQCSEVQINMGDRDGNTPLYYGIATKDKEIITMLSSVGGSMRVTNRDEEQLEPGKCMNCTRSLSTLLTLMLCIIAITCIITISSISIGFFGHNISQNALQRRKQAFSGVVSFIQSNVKQHTLVGNTAKAGFLDRFNISNRDDVMEYAYNVYKVNYGVSLFTIGVYFGLPNGALSGVVIQSDLKSSALFTSHDNPHILTYYLIPNITNSTFDDVITTADSWTESSTDEQNFAPWYMAAKTSNSSVWTESYVSSLFSNILFISYLIPFRDYQTHEWQGYIGLDMSTEGIGSYLKHVAAEYQSTIVIVERRTGSLIGSSDPSVSLYSQDGDTVIRHDGSEGGNKVMKKMLEYARSNYGGHYFSEVQNDQIFTSYYSDGRQYALNLGPFRDGYGIDWVILEAVPTRVFYHKFYISLITMFTVTTGLLIVGVLVSICAATYFMKPLNVLMGQAETIKLLRLEEVEKSLAKGLSIFTEIRSLQLAFKSMAVRLKQFRQFIPDHILTVIEAEVTQNEIIRQEVLADSLRQSSLKKRQGPRELDVTKTQSDTASDTRGSSISATFDSRGMVNNALTSTLASGSVTVMTVKFSDFSALLELHSSSEIYETTRDMLTTLKTCVKESNGQLVSLNSVNAVVVWNTFIQQNDHRQRACKTARACLASMRSLHDKWEGKGLPLLELRIGICSGTAYFGNLGTDATKFFTVIGKPADISSLFCSFNDDWGTKILCGGDVSEMVKNDYYTRPIDKRDDICIYELGDARNTDEWVHELEQDVNNTNDMWYQYNQAFELFERRELDEAYDMFTRFLDQHPHDTVAQKKMESCKAALSSNSSIHAKQIGTQSCCELEAETESTHVLLE